MEGIPKRKQTRLTYFDYSQPGSYFVTICTYEKHHTFGNIADGKLEPSSLGSLADQTWKTIPDWLGGVELDLFIVMPNHLHVIVNISGAPRAEQVIAPSSSSERPAGTKPHSLSAIIQAYKSRTSRLYRAACPECTQPIWQRGFYEHIIRETLDLEKIREYINNNPLQWELDQANGAKAVNNPFHAWMNTKD